MDTLLFVCTGNTCRSPMAEAIARHLLDKGLLGKSGKDIFVASAGVSAADGQDVTPETLAALSNLGIHHTGRSKPLTRQMIAKAAAVFCMTAGHYRAAAALVRDDPSLLPRIKLINPDQDIEDPIGHGQGAYDDLAQTLLTLIPARLKETLGHENSSRR